MRFPKAVAAWAVALGAAALSLPAQNLVVSLVPPAQAVPRGASIKLDLLAVNPSVSDAAFEASATLHGLLFADTGTWPVELQSGAAAPKTIRPGGFAYRGYVLVLPAEAKGRVVLEISEGRYAPLRTVILTGGEGAASPVAKNTSPLSALDAATPALARVQRGFAGHFAPHDPVYFAEGSKAPGAKFQFSFKYRLLDFQGDAGSTAQRTLQFGYTQRSLWDIAGDSSPFYDTSYMPSLFYESLAAQSENNRAGPFTWVGYQTGCQHESNGQSGLGSRSLNTFFVRPAFIVGAPDDWHVIIVPKIWVYVGDLSNNRNLTDYRGYGELFAVLGKNGGTALAYTGRAGRDFDRFTTQLDLTIPVRIKLMDFASYFLVQYFTGYGESLRDYDRKSSALRAGISLVR